jgi:hypothetical protein
MNSGAYGHNAEDWQFRNREYQGRLQMSPEPRVHPAGFPLESRRPLRVMPNGRPYQIPEPGKRVIDLEKDCGLILFDAAFFQQLPEYARHFMDEGNPILNAE